MTFKLAQLSDAHIGYGAGRRVDSQKINLRVRDGYRALTEAINQMIEQEVDVALFPGDIFHVPEPKIRDIIFMQQAVRRLADAGIPVYLLAGNHDALDVAQEIAASRVLDDPYRHIYSEYKPYVTHEIGDGILLHMVSHHLFTEQEATMKEVAPQEGVLNILSAHGSVIDPNTNLKLHTEQSPREIVLPGYVMDNPWTFTLLGHIHERGFVGSTDGGKSDSKRKKVFYDGSLIRRGFSDKPTKLGRGWTLWNIEPDGAMTPTFFTVEQRPQEDFRTIDAANLSASDITERMLKNLRNSYGYGEPFQEATAPILRQTIVNLTPAKHSGLDWKAINEASSHSFAWSLKTSVDSSAAVSPSETSVATSSGGNGDMLKVYEDWVQGSQAMTRVPKEQRPTVMEQGKKFIRSGQETVLDEA